MEITKDRIWVDGCFDFFHHGHANALRQAREHGKELIVGIHTDEAILYNKGPVVMTLAERVWAVDSCKWATESVPGAPYVTDPKVMDAHGCQFVVHGDDITTDANGVDSYQCVKDLGRFIVVKRTPEISTTDLISRMLGTAPPHSLKPIPRSGSHFIFKHPQRERLEAFASGADPSKPHAAVVAISTDLAVSRPVVSASPETAKLFENGSVYIPGVFDLVHSGHFEMLKAARELGKPLVVGLYDDLQEPVPLMNMFERALCLLQCRYVDGLVIGAPRVISTEFATLIKDFNVCCVAGASEPIESPCWPYKQIQRGENSKLSSASIWQRVLSQQDLYIQRQIRKGAKAATEADLRAAEIASNR